MKIQNKVYTFALMSLFIASLFAVALVSATGTNYESRSGGVEVQVTSGNPNPGQYSVQYTASGKPGGAPAGKGKSDPFEIPKETPRDPKTGKYFSLLIDIKNSGGEVISQVRAYIKPDGTLHNLEAIAGGSTYTLRPTR